MFDFGPVNYFSLFYASVGKGLFLYLFIFLLIKLLLEFLYVCREIMKLSSDFIILGRVMLSNNRKLWYSVGISSEQHSLHFYVCTL